MLLSARRWLIGFQVDPLEIETQLWNLKHLRIIEFENFEETQDRTEAEHEMDLSLVRRWSAACPSLTSIVLPELRALLVIHDI
jgi:hypothetical protein